MAATMTIRETIKREGYTNIDGVNVVYHHAEIRTDDPTNSTVNNSILDKDIYKQNRALCRQHIAEFEDEAYALQDEMMQKQDA